MGKRLTKSRTGYHEGWDGLDKVIMVSIMPVFMVLNMLAVHWTMNTFSEMIVFLVIALVLAPSNVLASRLVERLSDIIIRPRVFDREQRCHEIVPAYLEKIRR